jgi:hypothetical protein
VLRGAQFPDWNIADLFGEIFFEVCVKYPGDMKQAVKEPEIIMLELMDL